jgi:hypothetical protein
LNPKHPAPNALSAAGALIVDIHSDAAGVEATPLALSAAKPV